jgi:hypothetical protein
MDGYSGYGFSGGYGAWQTLMDQWSNYGVFTVLLPLVLVFAVVFAILERINLFKNRGVHLLIALVIGFFTISNPYISSLFMYLFANVGFGIAILIALVVLIGLAIKPDTKAWGWIFGIMGGVIFLAVLGREAYPGGPSGLRFIVGDAFWNWIQMNSAMVTILVIIAIAVIAVIAAGKTEEKAFGKIMPSS